MASHQSEGPVEAETVIQHAENVMLSATDAQVKAQSAEVDAETAIISTQTAEIHAEDSEVRAESATIHGPVGHLHLAPEKILDGNFQGANFGIQNVQTTVNHIYVAAPNSESPPGKSPQTGSLEGSEEDLKQGKAKLSDSIWMFRNKKLCKDGNVFEGEQMSKVFGQRKIAIKFLPLNERNVKEARILLKLTNHPHVVSIIHSDVCNVGPMEYMYIAMERCHTQNLHDFIKRNENYRFDPRVSVTHVRQLIQGLDHIHKQDIIHMDLKPENVLFSLDGNLVKIVDFGLSKELKSGCSQTAQSSRRVGTDGYRSPETYNSDVISKQADIFSLGLVIYFIWSGGEHPYGEEPDLWNYNIKTNKGHDLGQLKVTKTKEAEELIDHMLEFDPKKRPNIQEILKHSCLEDDDANMQGRVKKEITKGEQRIILDKGIVEFMKMHHNPVREILKNSKVVYSGQNVIITFKKSDKVIETLLEIYTETVPTIRQQCAILDEDTDLNKVTQSVARVREQIPNVGITIVPLTAEFKCLGDPTPGSIRFLGHSHQECESARRMLASLLNNSWLFAATLPANKTGDSSYFSHKFRNTEIKVSVVLGNIVEQDTDVIVSSTNDDLMDEGVGVAAAVSKAGGEELRQKCLTIMKQRNYKPLEEGELVHTEACGDLLCKNVIHTCGPVVRYRTNSRIEETGIIMKKLCSGVLTYAEHLEARSLAIPAISTGYRGVPLTTFSNAILDAIIDFHKEAEKVEKRLKEIRVVSLYLSEAGVIASQFNLRKSELPE